MAGIFHLDQKGESHWRRRTQPLAPGLLEACITKENPIDRGSPTLTSAAVSKLAFMND